MFSMFGLRIKKSFNQWKSPFVESPRGLCFGYILKPLIISLSVHHWNKNLAGRWWTAWVFCIITVFKLTHENCQISPAIASLSQNQIFTLTVFKRNQDNFWLVVHDNDDWVNVSPPPQRRHRARSFPVPRGRMATGGCRAKLALSGRQMSL